MRKINLDGVANVKGFKFEISMKIDSAEIVNDKHECGNKEYDASKKEIKGFEIKISTEAEEAEINLKAFGKDIKEVVKEQIEKNTVSTTKAASK